MSFPLKASLGARCLKAPGPFQWRQYTADMWYPFRVLDRISELAQGCNKMVQSCMHTTMKQELWWMHIIAILYMTLGIKICWLSNHATKWHMNIVILQYWWSQYYTYDKSAMTITRNYMWQVQKAQPYSTNTPQSKWSDQSGHHTASFQTRPQLWGCRPHETVSQQKRAKLFPHLRGRNLQLLHKHWMNYCEAIR